MSIEAIKLMRDKANSIVEEYCIKSGEDSKQVIKFIHESIDEYNLKLPIDFYRDYYNYCITEVKNW